ncbi:c-type cytochrome [Pseudoxanthomonas sacheonensis]|uniref:Cytochrome c553 n=1 Tax=Pseudoxanthomonas sacheonensis TaxID=443615 RepID=A0ABU1RTP8_9GAMM|nr:c-type cytochrome [Pseudoxanthomonas sacheonensis]MDR6842147.1 cytochrome c553 [Pseudoxanthomonas sacheonensis]
MSPTLKRILKRSIIVVALLAVAACLAVFALSQQRLQRDYRISVSLPPPRAALADEGAKLARSRGCADCHGDDFGGKVLLDQMPFARIVGTNLTPGKIALGPARSHERFHRALHHGVDMHSRPLLMMPSAEFTHLSAHEIEALSAYLAGMPQVERVLPKSAMGPLARAMLVGGKLDGFLSAETIDHGKPAVAHAPPLGTLAYGEHAAQLCTGCHRADFGGGAMSHGGPDAPAAANLTAHASGLGAWTEADFIAAMRTGTRPDGSGIDGAYMPWRAVGQASDQELHSIWIYLRSRAPVERQTRSRD